MRRRRFAVAVVSIVFTTLATLSLTAQPAVAAPTGCGSGWAGVGNAYATAYCSGGTGSYQVWAQCYPSVWPYNWAFVESPWYRAGSGATAWVWCPPGKLVSTWGVGRRN